MSSSRPARRRSTTLASIASRWVSSLPSSRGTLCWRASIPRATRNAPASGKRRLAEQRLHLGVEVRVGRDPVAGAELEDAKAGLHLHRQVDGRVARIALEE